VAIVTGGSTGLGRAIAHLYAEEGAKVVIADIRQEDGDATVAAIGDAGGEALFVETDVTRGMEVEALVRAAEHRYGRLDIVTANAGIMGRCAGLPLEEVQEADFDHVMDVNFKGVWLLFKHAIPAIRRAGGGAMTATSSISAIRGFARMDPYVASKAAIGGLIRSLSADLAPEIRVNAVLPGGMVTELTAHTSEEMDASSSVPASTSTRRVEADPREVAQAHLFLVSDASSFVTGHELVADGGRTVFPG
jgi:NAD(P)-dependent dehydrogenase (short-subunit alcohol dehydrogenase family)